MPFQTVGKTSNYKQKICLDVVENSHLVTGVNSKGLLVIWNTELALVEVARSDYKRQFLMPKTN